MFTDRILEKGILKSFARRIAINLESKNPDSVYCDIKDLNSSQVIELPTINYSRYNGLAYRFVYGAQFYTKPFSIVKIDVETGSVCEMNFGNDLPSEPVFVEKPNAQKEDDGVLLIMCISSNGHDYLSVLDANDLTEIGRAELPDEAKNALAMTFHGFFADSKKFKALN